MGTFTKNSDNCVNANGTARPPKRLLDQISDRIRFKHYSIRQPDLGAMTFARVASRIRVTS